MTQPTKPTKASSSAPFAKGSIIWEKKGPLPVWAWALIVLLIVLVFAWWRRNRAAAKAAEGQPDTYTSAPLPGDQSAPNVINVGPINLPKIPPSGPTRPETPPGGGRPQPPGTPPIATNPEHMTQTHTQARKGGSVVEFTNYYYGADAGTGQSAWNDWVRINKQFAPLSDIEWVATSSGGGKPVFKKDVTYRLPAYERVVFGKYPAT